MASRFRVSVGMISGENRTSTARRPCGVSFSAERSFCVKAASTAGTSRISDTSGRRVSAFVSTSRTMIPFLEGRARRTSPTTPSRKRSSNHGKPVERTYSCTSGLIHWASKSALTGVASFSASEARKASCASGEVSCPLISLSIPKIFCRNAAISVTLRSNTVGWSMAT